MTIEQKRDLLTRLKKQLVGLQKENGRIREMAVKDLGLTELA